MFSKHLVAAVAAMFLATGGSLAAHSYTAGDLVIGHPWARETAPGQSAGGGFMTVTNKGAQADRLLSGTSPAAKDVQIHSVNMDGGVMRMRPLPHGLPVPAGQTVALKPGGYHIMLLGLKQPLKQGSRVPVTLHFQRAGKVRVELAVAPIGAAAAAAGESSRGHRHD
ncbi:hypothetical protein NT2_08_00170 [Caenibius tardaugens NBRC 16725]|uniref:Copper chaperone PCu(A)C n=1 Tax=Caenibius tardaugens NBRC 16725 TaxID=1219035 RepID=U2YN56_9SPHN|nr:copper chaperone PCu(A)C [Caenibius tardaugens]GAD50230.1 hypothetical protein NT2_08_00170 [Caenibius tardaugens NBRC 16725]